MREHRGSLPNLVPNYFPSSSRSARRSSADAALAKTAPACAADSGETGTASSPDDGGPSGSNGGLPSSIDELFAEKSSSSSSPSAAASHSSSPAAPARAVNDGGGRDGESVAATATSIEELYAPSSAATSPPSGASSEGSVSPRLENTAMAAAATASNNGAPPSSSLLDGAPVALACPARIKVFLALPMDRFFDNEHGGANVNDAIVGEGSPSTRINAAVSPPQVAAPPPSEYRMPSNYDILCGPDRQSFFHHVGNRRFRITIEMNARRYERAYLASMSSGNVAPSADAEGGGGEKPSIDDLIDEMLRSLSECDPPGRFLGMEMTTGRWRILNPVYARLKTEQTFYECLQVEQRRLGRQLEEEWRVRIEREKESLLEELEGRIQTAQREGRMGGLIAEQRGLVAAAAARRSGLMAEQRGLMAAAAAGRPHPAVGMPQLLQQQHQHQASRRVSQSSLASVSETATTCPSSVCLAALALRNPLPAADGAGDNDDLSLLQSRAKALLRRRLSGGAAGDGIPQQFSSLTPSVGNHPNGDVAGNANALNNTAMEEIVQRFAREQEQQQQQLLERLQHAASAAHANNPIAARQSSMPSMLAVRPFPAPSRASFTGGQFDGMGNGGVGIGNNNGNNPLISSLTSRVAKRGSNFSCDSHDSVQSLSRMGSSAIALSQTGSMMASMAAAATSGPAASSPALGSNNSSRGGGVKDLLDVVGGMMMMSRRGSC